MKSPHFRTLSIAIAIASLAILAAYDNLQMGIGLFNKRPPAFDQHHFVRSLIMLSCSVLLVSAIGVTRRPTTGQPFTQSSVVATYASASLATLAALLFVWSPPMFSGLSREDGIVESISAAALLLASVIFLIAGFRRAAREGGWNNGSKACAALALLTLVIGMEEISWGQRLIGFETPDIFSSNVQHETNLHNFMTHKAENLYYAGSFLLLIAAPYLNDAYRFAVGNHALADVAPDRSVALVAAPFTAFSWEMWNVIPVQMTFYLTIAILVASLRGPTIRPKAEMQAVAAALFATLLVQVAFLLFGYKLVRSWEATEYKELFISLAFIFYAFTVAAKMGTFKRAICAESKCSPLRKDDGNAGYQRIAIASQRRFEDSKSR